MKDLTMWSKNSPLHNDWYNFAVELVGKNNAENIQCTHFGGGNRLALQRMLTLWYNSTIDYSWQMIIDALTDMEEACVIESIRRECQIN